MREDVASFSLSGPVLEKVRIRARREGVSEDQVVRDVLDAALEPAGGRAILALDCVEEDGEIVVDRKDGEPEADYRARSELYNGLFRPDR